MFLCSKWQMPKRQTSSHERLWGQTTNVTLSHRRSGSQLCKRVNDTRFSDQLLNFNAFAAPTNSIQYRKMTKHCFKVLFLKVHSSHSSSYACVTLLRNNFELQMEEFIYFFCSQLDATEGPSMTTFRCQLLARHANCSISSLLSKCFRSPTLRCSDYAAQHPN